MFNMFNYLESIKDENLKLIPQCTVKRVFMDEKDRRNAIWDMFVTKNGRCFVAICAEQFVSEPVSLYEYIYETNELKLCFNLVEKVCHFNDAITPSKIHTSMCEMPDGRIIMTTHTTAQSKVHPYWHPEPFYNHTFEGYQGSNILIYDPDTGALENRGVPIPHESIYGGCYDPKKNCYYFTGYFRGHLYRYDIDNGAVRDYGKVTEFGTFRLHLGRDGNIYSASRSGNFYRINTETQEIEELGILFPKDYEPYSSSKHVQLDYLADAPDGGLYFKYIFGKNLYRYDYEKNTLDCIGEYMPDTLDYIDPYSAYGLICDENGVFWYIICMCDSYFELNNAYLCRWDVLGGKKPQNMGLLGTPERSLTVPSEMHYRDGILYVADSNHHFDVPGIFTVDLRLLESLDYSLSDNDLLFAKDIVNYGGLRNPKAFYKYSEQEYDAQVEHNKFFFDYIADYNAFLNDNQFNIAAKHITPYAFWKQFGSDCSQVKNVRFEGDSIIAQFGNEDKKYFFDSQKGEYNEITEYAEINLLPEVIRNSQPPFAAGRKFKSVPTAAVRIFEDKYLVGTNDGILAVFDGENYFNLGSCPNCSGQVVDICYCEKTQTAYGIIGSKNDIAMLFSFDKKNGVKYMGKIHFTNEYGLYASCELSCIAVNEQGTRLAVGSAERMGVLYEIEL